MGGWVAMRVAIDHPELIDRLVVYNSAGITMEPPPAGTFHPQNENDIQRLLSLLEPGQKPLPHFIARDFLKRFQGNQDVIDRSYASMLTGHDIVDSEIGSLRQPFLIVWGSTDALIPLSTAQQLHGMDPRSELDIVEGCGHIAPLFCSGRVAAATADFLKSNPAPSGGVRTLAQMH